ncbi:MAG: adenylate cyclase [Alphaproteobacteria bacterium]|jgi:adenylate cyclase
MERRLAAILAIDMVGYSRLMGVDEAGTISRQKRHREAFIDPQIAHYNGRIVKTTGDGLLAEFPSVVDAVDCAVAFQTELLAEEGDASEDSRILYRAGINLGDIVIDGDDILGDGVNVAARLEAISPPAGLCVSDMVRQNLRGALGDTFEDMGEQSLKNIDRKIRVWRWPAGKINRVGPVRGTTSAPGDNLPSTIAVLAFETLSPNPDHRFYAEGFAEDIATGISKLDMLRVISSDNAADNLASHHVEGTVQVAGSRIRCSVQLRDVVDGHHLWAEKFDGSIEDIFDFQDRITGEVVSALEVELTEGEQTRLWRREAGDPLAYEEFMKGRAAYKEYSRPGNARARAAYEVALTRSPIFHSAAVALARTYIEDATFGWTADGHGGLQDARRFLDGVFAIDPNHPAAHTELAHILMVEGNFAAARLEAELAVALDPNAADAHQALAHMLICLELPEEALRVSRRAVGLNPGAPEFYLIAMAEAHIMLKRYQEAQAVSEKIIAKRPEWIMARILSVLALQGLGKEAEAREEVQNLLEISPRFTAERWQKIIFYPNRSDVPELVKRLTSVGLPS